MGSITSLTPPQENQQVQLLCPGRRTRFVWRILKCVFLVFLVSSTFLFVLPVRADTAGSGLNSGRSSVHDGTDDLPKGVGADPVPDLALPKTVISSVDSLISAGGVIQTSSENLTLYNRAVSIRLLGGSNPHDELLDQDFRVLSPYSSWDLEVLVRGSWLPLLATNNSFTVLGTNRTGTYVIRTMRVESSSYTGYVNVAYKLRASGELKWDIGFSALATGQYRLVYVWDNVSLNSGLESQSRRFRSSYQAANYTFSWEDIPNYKSSPTITPGRFSLHVDLGIMFAGQNALADPSLFSSAVSSATAFTFQRKVFHDAKGGFYFVFYDDGTQIAYRSSPDGLTWRPPQALPSDLIHYSATSETRFPYVFNVGQQVVLATGEEKSRTDTTPWAESVSVRWVSGNVTGPSISWGNVYPFTLSEICNADSPSCAMTLGVRFVSVGASSDGTTAVAYNWFLSRDSKKCSGPWSESRLFILFKEKVFRGDGVSGCGQFDQSNKIKPVVLPSDSGHVIKVVYQFKSAFTSLIELRMATFNAAYSNTASEYVYPDKDTWVDYSSPSYRDGSGPNLLLIGGSLPAKALVYFSLPRVIPYAQISSATLSINVEAHTCTADQCATTIFPAGFYWKEDISASEVPSGGSTSPTASVNLNTDGIHGIDVSEIVKNWYRYGSNLGFKFELPSGTQGSYEQTYFSSREDSPSNTQPTLALLYCCEGSSEVVDSDILDSYEFSAVSDIDHNIHAVYRTRDGKISHILYSASAGSWGPPSRDIFGGTANYPTVTIDYATGDIYALAIKGSSIVMKTKPSLQSWTERPAVFPVTVRTNPVHLGSNLASVSNSNASWVTIVWTEEAPGGGYNVAFASVPIQTVWSPYGLTKDPWDGNGLAPNGQYLSDLGEHVSPSTGMLTVRQTDLSVPGRGLNFEITRVYAEPYSFLGTGPNPYESYPWAPMGNGWQLNYPWFTGVSNPTYIHLWDAQGYRIPSSFWTGASGVYENHQGEHFRLTRNSTGIYLFTRAGLFYIFDTGYKLLRITDTTGNNTIAFTYGSNRIASINDTVGRVFLFCYSGTQLQTIFQSSATCASPGAARSIRFTYTGLSLASVIDPGGRITAYQYTAVSDPNISPWLISRITYPTQWYTSYTYSPVVLGTEATSFRVFQQLVSSPTSSIRRSDFQYSPPSGGDPINGATVQHFDGSSGSLQSTGYTHYSFSFDGMTMNTTTATDTLVRGLQQRFGANGEVPREVVLVTDGSGGLGSYTNYYRYDLWGNLIYRRSSINPSANRYHESFNAYYNELPLGFYSFAETFSRDNGGSPDASWKGSGTGTWRVEGGEYSLTGTRGNETRAEVFHRDASLQVTVRWVDGPWFEGYLGFRYQASGNHYRVYLSSYDNTLRFDKVWTGAITTLASATVTPSLNRNYVIRVQSSGYYHDVYLDGLFKFQVYDPDSSMSEGTYIALGTFAASTSSGPVHIHFDDILISPAPNTYANNFYTNTLRTSIHDRLAGNAGLQNGTGSLPIEGYLGYSSWGGPTQSRQRYDPVPGTTRWLEATNSYDRYGNLLKAIDPRGNSTYYNYSTSYQSAYLTNQTSVDGATQITTLYGYNLTTGTLVSSRDPRLGNTTYQYDALNRLTRVTPPGGGFTSYTYNDASNYVDTINEKNWKTRRAYDGLGRLVRVEHFSGSVSYSNETYIYDSADKVVASTNARGNTTQYQYDVLGRPTRVTKPDGNFTVTLYNDLQSTVSTRDENDYERVHYSDRLGRRTAVAEQSKLNCISGYCQRLYYVSSYFYDEVGNLVKVDTLDRSDYLVNPSFETGDFTGWTQENMRIDADSPSAYQHSHDGLFFATSSAPCCGVLQQNFASPAPGSLVVSFGFWIARWDPTDIIRVLYSDGTYTDSHPPTGGLCDSLGYCLVSPAFDRAKQITGIRLQMDPAGPNHIFTVDGFFLRTVRSARYGYDNLNRLTSTSIPDGMFGTLSEIYTYDDAGNLVKKIDQKGVRTLYAYDSLNRLKTITYCGNPITSDNYTYDKNGNVLTLENQNATLTYSYDPRNRLLTETYSVNPAGRQVVDLGCPAGGGGGSVAYGTLISLADGATVPVQNLQVGMKLLSYDTTAGQYAVSTLTRLDEVYTTNMLVVRTEDPLPLRVDNATAQKLWVKKSDGAVGWLSVTQLRPGDYLFNTLQQRWTKVVSVELAPKGIHVMYDIFTSAPFNYVANGYLDPQKEGPTGPQTSLSGGTYQNYVVRYSYSGDVLSGIRYPDGFIANYTYDDLGRVTTVYKPGSKPFNYAQFDYYKDSTIRTLTFGNKLVASYTYDKVSRPSQIRLVDPTNNNKTLVLLNYAYHKTGAIAAIAGNSTNTSGAMFTVNEQHQYDALLRITNSTVRTGSAVSTLWYEYDPVGNRVRQSANGTLTRYAFDPRNDRLTNSTAFTTPTKTVSYTYDSNGNLVLSSERRGGTSTTWGYDYDVAGHLLSVGKNYGNVGKYAYDGMGRRVESVEGTAITFYAYGTTETLFEKVSNTNTDYLSAAGVRIARVVGNTVNYYHTDHLGSTRLVTDSSSQVKILFSDSYQPYGQDNGAPSGSETYKFTGKPVSATTGLYYYGARWYDPTVGRFISQDPILGHLSAPQTLNRYTYVVNSPLNGVDPTGLDCFSSLGDFGNCLWDSTIGAGINSYNWYQTANEEDRRAFWTGVGVAVGIGVVVGVSCVFAGCAGLALLGIGALTGVAGSLWGGVAYRAAGGSSQGGLEATMFWGGLAASLAFSGSYAIGSRLLASRALTSEVPGGVRATFEEGQCAEACLISDWNGFQYGNGPGWSGNYATPTLYNSATQARAALNLPPWNTASFVRPVVIPKGTVIALGPVRGGTGFQVFVGNRASIIAGQWIRMIPSYVS